MGLQRVRHDWSDLACTHADWHHTNSMIISSSFLLGKVMPLTVCVSLRSEGVTVLQWHSTERLLRHFAKWKYNNPSFFSPYWGSIPNLTPIKNFNFSKTVFAYYWGRSFLPIKGSLFFKPNLCKSWIVSKSECFFIAKSESFNKGMLTFNFFNRE